jgi:hypothetical protein
MKYLVQIRLAAVGFGPAFSQLRQKLRFGSFYFPDKRLIVSVFTVA